MTHYNADPKQRAGLLMQALKGDAAALARDAVPTEQLQQPDAFDRIVAALDVHYGLRASTRQLKAFLELMSAGSIVLSSATALCRASAASTTERLARCAVPFR